MTTGRLFEILYYLMDVKQTTAQQLADHFEVSIRTIYRDIDRLIAAGIPIYTKQGIEGGIILDQNFVLDKTLLDDNDQRQILSALETLSSLHIHTYDELLKRMQIVFQKEKQDWIEVDFSSWQQNLDLTHKFDLIKKAILEHQALSFDYVSSSGKQSHRHVYPLKIFFKGQAWYLHAYDIFKETYRTYKLTRIYHLRELDEFFDNNQFAQKPVMFLRQESMEMIDVVLRFEKYLGSYVYDEFEYEDVFEEEDYYLVKTRIVNEKWLVSFLLSFGSGLEVIEPVSLREQIYNEIIKLNNLYKPDR